MIRNYFLAGAVTLALAACGASGVTLSQPGSDA